MSSDLVTPTVLQVASSPEDDIVVLHLAGEVDIATCPALDAAMERVLADCPRAIALDMSEVTFMACAGASSILEWWYGATKQRVRLGIVNPSDAVKRVLHAMRLDVALVRDPSVVTGPSRFL